MDRDAGHARLFPRSNGVTVSRKVIGVIALLLGAFLFAFVGDLAGGAVSGHSGIVGAIGEQGDSGPQGQAGSDGQDGADGADGVNGIAGAQGLRGLMGATGAIGSQGPAGADGQDGLPGTPGAPGIPGLDGSNGLNGLPGTPGEDGLNGNDGAPGKDGLNGQDGAAGKDGADGKDGAPGLPGPSTVRSDMVGTIVIDSLIEPTVVVIVEAFDGPQWLYYDIRSITGPGTVACQYVITNKSNGEKEVGTLINVTDEPNDDPMFYQHPDHGHTFSIQCTKTSAESPSIEYAGIRVISG